MEYKGTLKNISKDWDSGHFQLTYETETDITGQIESIRGKQLRIIAKQWREKRSLDANAYYWQLITKLADVQRVSKPYMHNMMLRRYGQTELINGQMVFLVLPDSEEGIRKAEEAETYHIRPTPQVKIGNDGKPYRTYIMLRGSSDYDTREMSVLIDGLVSECKENGIETLPPDEIMRMMEQYDQNRSQP